MPTITAQDSTQDSTDPAHPSSALTGAPTLAPTVSPAMSPDMLRKRMAEAATYAVLRRIAPVLRHDVAGLMQPAAIIMAILQKRIQMPEPDLQAIAKNLASVSASTKEATAGCVSAIGWIATNEDSPVNLRSSVDQAAQLLGMELSAAGLEVRNDIADDNRLVPQSFYRSVLIGALLAFCDYHTKGGTLQVTLKAGVGNTGKCDQLCLRLLPRDTDKAFIPTDLVRKSRTIDWTDVQAMAGSFSVAMAQGDGWLTLDLAR